MRKSWGHRLELQASPAQYAALTTSPIMGATGSPEGHVVPPSVVLGVFTERCSILS
jgi:hypothetical protein